MLDKNRRYLLFRVILTITLRKILLYYLGYSDIFKVNLSNILPTTLYIEGPTYFPLKVKNSFGTDDFRNKASTKSDDNDSNTDFERNEQNSTVDGGKGKLLIPCNVYFVNGICLLLYGDYF